MAFYAFRDMQSCRWEPFLAAAVERNPVAVEKSKGKDTKQVYSELEAMNNQSIYNGHRLATPDEVCNYRRGDGVEKAITLANIIHSRNPAEPIEILIDYDSVIVKAEGEYKFTSAKKLQKTIHICQNKYTITG